MNPSYLVLLHAKISLLSCALMLYLGFYRGWMRQTEECVSVTGKTVDVMSNAPGENVSPNRHACCLGAAQHPVGCHKFGNEMKYVHWPKPGF